MSSAESHRPTPQGATTSGHVVRPHRLIPFGETFVMANYDHPEVDMFEFGMDANGRITSKPAPIPDGRIVLCHPDDEERVRDLIALAQEGVGDGTP